jgi:hypothetical protein
MHGLDCAGDSLDFIATVISAPGLIEDAVFGEDLVDGRASARRIVFAEHVMQIAGQQGRNAV